MTSRSAVSMEATDSIKRCTCAQQKQPPNQHVREQAAPVIPQCSSSISVQARHTLARRARAYNLDGHLAKGTCPLSHHLISHLLDTFHKDSSGESTLNDPLAGHSNRVCSNTQSSYAVKKAHCENCGDLLDVHYITSNCLVGRNRTHLGQAL